MQQRLQPGDQILVNFAELIHNRVSDRKGNVLPADLTYGTYDVWDLGSGHGNLSVGGMALDKTWGYRTVVQSPDCCGFGAPLIDPSAVDLSVGGVETVGVDALDQCTNQEVRVFTDITAWWSGNTAIATVSKGKVTGVLPGYTTVNGSGEILQCFGNTEYMEPVDVQAPINVCPSSTSIGSTTAESLSNVLATYKTGLGAVVGVNFSPAAPDGLIITETLSNGTNTCPQGFPTNVCTPNGNLNTASLSVGTAGTATDGTRLAATPNTMWDEHVVASASSLLGSSGKQCSIQCSQQYSCGGAVIGNYTITYTFSTGTINGTPVTNVKATVQ